MLKHEKAVTFSVNFPNTHQMMQNFNDMISVGYALGFFAWESDLFYPCSNMLDVD